MLINPAHLGHPDYLRNIRTAAKEVVRILPHPDGELRADRGCFQRDQTRSRATLDRARGWAVLLTSAPDADLAAQQHLPTIFSTREPVQVGGLVSYGPNLAAQFLPGATYVDKILKGARLGDLPVEQPTTFELVINLKIAKAIGLSRRRELLPRADVLLE